jgi:hypothetical protein
MTLHNLGTSNKTSPSNHVINVTTFVALRKKLALATVYQPRLTVVFFFFATFNENGKAFKGGEWVSLDRSKETGLQ